MEKYQFNLEGEYIELIKLIKVMQIANSGAQAKLMVENHEVIRNGNIELRKRAKLIKGDLIEIFDMQIEIV
jgi:ribosome-associated protein